MKLHLPGILGVLARAGYGAEALALLEKRGGTEVYVPSVPWADCALALIVGLDAAQVAAEVYGGHDVDVPNARWYRRAVRSQIIASQAGTREVARALDCTERYVRMVRADLREPDPRQPSLFD